MEIRQAILRAADSIEQNPRLFNFMTSSKPDPNCGTPGCVLGWIGFHLGIIAINMPTPTAQALGCPKETLPISNDLVAYEDWGFYRRMTEISGNSLWRYSPGACASALRKYADKYHPATGGMPDSVRRIFAVENLVDG